MTGQVLDYISASGSRLPLIHPPVGEQTLGCRVNIVHIVCYLALDQCSVPDSGLGDIPVERSSSAVAGAQVEASRIVAGQVYGLGSHRHSGGILAVNVYIPGGAAPNRSDVVSFARLERLVGCRRLVGIMANLKHVVVDLHVAEAHAAHRLNAHDRADIRIAGLEGVHIDPCLESQLLEGGKRRVHLEGWHFVDVALFPGIWPC